MKLKAVIFLLALFLFTPIFLIKAATTAASLKGRILLQVEAHGEAWYVNPKDSNRYYMKDGDAALKLMREAGIGISNDNLKKILVADVNLKGDKDTDSDGLSDSIEDALGTDKTKADSDGDGYNDKDEVVNGYNPLGAGKINVDLKLSKSQAGKILLQVESHGEAWYVNPSNNKRYFLGRPGDAYNLMRSLGLGITNSNLNKIVEKKDANQVQSNTTNTDTEISNLALSKLDSAMCNTIKDHKTQGKCLAVIEYKKGNKHPCAVLGNNYPELADDCKNIDMAINYATVLDRDTRTIADVRMIQVTLEMYYNYAGKYPSVVNSGFPLTYQGNTYISAIPTAVAGTTSACLTDFQYKYTYINDGKYSLTYCIDGTSDVSKGFAGINTATQFGIR